MKLSMSSYGSNALRIRKNPIDKAARDLIDVIRLVRVQLFLIASIGKF